MAGYSNIPSQNCRSQINSKSLEFQKLTSKIAYNNLVSKKSESPFQEKVWQKVLGMEKINFANVYTTKIKITDKKLAEFNFKVLHLILPCGVNLKRWGIKDDNKCKICSELHDIPHLLFYCTKAKIVWDIVSRICGIDVSLRDVILSDQESDIAMLVIIVAYSIYKEWLLYGHKENWQANNILTQVKSELSLRIKIYENIQSLSSIVKFLKYVSENFV